MKSNIQVGGDLADVLMPPMTVGQFADFEKKVERQTVEYVLSKLEEVLEPKTSPKLISQIIEDLKDSIYEI
jgi:hypothetical protein